MASITITAPSNGEDLTRPTRFSRLSTDVARTSQRAQLRPRQKCHNTTKPIRIRKPKKGSAMFGGTPDPSIRRNPDKLRAHIMRVTALRPLGLIGAPYEVSLRSSENPPGQYRNTSPSSSQSRLK